MYYFSQVPSFCQIDQTPNEIMIENARNQQKLEEMSFRKLSIQYSKKIKKIIIEKEKIAKKRIRNGKFRDKYSPIKKVRNSISILNLNINLLKT